MFKKNKNKKGKRIVNQKDLRNFILGAYDRLLNILDVCDYILLWEGLDKPKTAVCFSLYSIAFEEYGKSVYLKEKQKKAKK